MSYPSWPDNVPDVPLIDSLSEEEPYLEPQKTEMDGGNKRMRSRPGDEIQRVTYAILMTKAEAETFMAWARTNKASRWTSRIWTGSSMQDKLCQFEARPKRVDMFPKVRVELDVWVLRDA